MPYTPPSYNGVVFDFTDAYSVPSGTAVTFNFGGTPVPPTPGDPQPFRRSFSFLEEEPWLFNRRRILALPPLEEILPYTRKLFVFGEEEETHTHLSRRRIGVIPPRRRTPVLYTVI